MRISDWSSDVCSSDLGGSQKEGRHSAKSAAPSRLEMCEPASGRLAQILGPVVIVLLGRDRVVTVLAGIVILGRIGVLEVLGEGGAQRRPGRLLDAVEAHRLRQPGARLLADLRFDDALAVAQRSTGAGAVALLGVLVADQTARAAHTSD